MSSENKIEFYFLRASAEKFATDLRHFAKDVHTFSDEQLLAIVSYCDHIRDNMANVKKELERRVWNNKYRDMTLSSKFGIYQSSKYCLKKTAS